MSTMAKQAGAMPVDDPFVSPSPSMAQRHRYSVYDATDFSANSNGSPTQIKLALQAHLAETDRRLQDASQIGSVLVKQRQELADRIRDVDTTASGQDIPAELRQKVAVLEKEVAEISRETARIFVPKNRASSGETTADLNGAVLSSQAQHSPTKVHAPTSRKTRNQPQTRLNDVKLATALTDTLLSQMRELQAAYAEREEALRHANSNNAELEADLDALRAKVRALDDSEQRFKDENWSLETQVSDLLTAQKDASSREQKLALNLNASKSQHESIQREFEELKQAHTKLSDDHAVAQKQHDVELGALRRNATANEGEVDNLRKKIDDLTNQNKDLAKAFAARLREGERVASQQFALAPSTAEDDQQTPDNSPPPSPSKATPRHGALESETLKSSLHHAQRMIQHLKNNIHREKTEKFELKKLLQEARDDLETKRKGDSAGKSKRTSKQVEAKKLPRPDRLGAPRNSKDEVFMDDQEWEDGDLPDTPSKTVSQDARQGARPAASETTRAMPGAYADTATEASDAFETANENTETEAFQTGVETLDGNSDSDELTETEQKTPTDTAKSQAKALNRYSFHSTASTSDDEETSIVYQTPLHKSQTQLTKHRVVSLSQAQSSPAASSDRQYGSREQTPLQDSPASLVSSTGTPVQGKSLFAELDGLSDDGTEASGTPQSQAGSSRFSSPYTPQVGRKSISGPSKLRTTESYERRPAMVDMATMTDKVDFASTDEPKATLGVAALVSAAGLGAALNETTRTVRHEEHQDEAPVENLAHTEPNAFAEVAHIQPVHSQSGTKSQDESLVQVDTARPAPRKLEASNVLSLETSPVQISVTLVKADIMSHETVPIELPVPQIAPSAYHAISSVHSEPVSIAPVTPIAVPLSEVSASKRSVDRSTETTSQQAVSAPTVDRSTETEAALKAPLRVSALMIQETVPVAESKSVAAIEPPILSRKHSPSQIMSQETVPTDAFTVRSLRTTTATAGAAAVIGGIGLAGSTYRRTKERNAPVVVAEDSTSQPAVSASAEAADIADRTPLQAVDGNGQTQTMTQSPSPKIIATLHESTQTKLSGTDIETLFSAHNTREGTSSATAAVVSNDGSPRKVREHVRRPSSSGSSRNGRSPPPPLPAEAKTVIAAQRASLQTNVNGPAAPGSMGPPIMPASAYKRNNGGKLVSSTTAQNAANTTTTVANRSGLSSPRSRRSSASSFASELDHRFNLNGHSNALANYGTDPRMLRALTETMLGEWMYKYTSGSGADGASSNRHQRFFWVHPYTLTLYWSTERPQESNKKKNKASAVSINSVRAVQDDNPNPPGLHNKSIVIETPHRTIKMTALTAQRHETWLNALSYLLLKQHGKDDDDDITAEDIADFDPNVRSSSRTTQRSRTTVSTHASRASGVQYPTLRPAQQRSQSVEPSSISSRFTAVFRTPQSFRGSRSSRYSQATQSVGNSTSATPLETPTATTRNSAEEARRAIEAQEREAFRMENVRACCDGKHDVGSLSRAQPPVGSKSHRVSFGPSLSGSTSTHRRNESDSKSMSRRHVEMDPANIVDDE